ncbi:MAG: hypothetical protein PHE61_00270 [Candidatus Omnitrophica bacterium]|nr:hypothetical protein [Candidatus Omnitrophota bacterium]
MALRVGEKASVVLCFLLAGYLSQGALLGGVKSAASAEGCNSGLSWKAESADGFFRCEVPANWAAWRDTDRESEEAKVYPPSQKAPSRTVAGINTKEGTAAKLKAEAFERSRVIASERFRPAERSKSMGRSCEAAGLHGIFLKGPRNRENRPPTIYLRYHSGTDPLFPDAKSYLARQLEPGPVPLVGEKTTDVKPVTVGGLSGSRFIRGTFDYIPPHSMDTKEIRVREEYVVLTGKKGFFVFVYSAPKSLFKHYRPVFQHVLDTFEPLKERSRA